MDRMSKNFWKKFLTNEMKSSIIAMFRRERRAPCKLNNVKLEAPEKDEKSFLRQAIGIGRLLTNFFEAMIKFRWNDLDRLEGLYRYHFIESLILAQDERWRRA